MLLHVHMHWCKWLLKHSLQLCELVAHLIVVVDFFYTKHTLLIIIFVSHIFIN